jgi:hypothetical protein
MRSAFLDASSTKVNSNISWTSSDDIYCLVFQLGFIRRAKPTQDTLSARVNTTHNLYLASSLLDILLVNAQSIYPKNPLGKTSERPESKQQVLTHRKQTIVEPDSKVEFVDGAPNV